MERIERSSVAYHATALPLSYIGWSRRGYSKPRPPHYGCGAPPLELLRRGASAENRTPLIGLAIRCPANRPHPPTRAAGASRRTGVSPLCASTKSSCIGGAGHNQSAPRLSALCAIQKLERTEIIEISSLGWRPRAHPIYHARSSTFLNSYQLSKTNFEHTSTPSLPVGGKLDKMPQITDKQKKTGGH